MPFAAMWMEQEMVLWSQTQKDKYSMLSSNVKSVIWYQFSSVTQLYPTLCNHMDYSSPGFPVLHHLPESAQTHAHLDSDTIQQSHPLSSTSPDFSSWRPLSQHQGLLKWVSSSHQVAKVLELQLQHWALQWIFRVDFLKDWPVGSPCYSRDLQESSPAPQFKSINSLALSLLHGPTLTSIPDCWKSHSFDYMDLCQQSDVLTF